MAELGRSSRFGGSGVLTYRAWRFLSAGLEVGYHSLKGFEQSTDGGPQSAIETSFEMVPIQLSVEASRRVGSVEAFAAVGAAITVFNYS